MGNESVRSCSTEVLEHEMVTLAAQIAQATCRFLLVIAELDRRKAWAQWDGCKGMAHWLSWRCSLSPRAAREQVRVANALCSLPTLAEVFGRGELSYSKVRALVRVATPECEAGLVDLARTATAAQLERIIRASVIALADPARREELCELVTGVDDEGFGTVRARIPIEQLPIVEQAITAALPTTDGGSAEPLARRKADALVRICESYLANGDAARPPSMRNEAVIHVQVDDAGVVEAHTQGGDPVHPETAKRILCDGRVQGMLGDLTGPIGAGRRTRAINRRMRRALQRRSRARCEWIGCDERVYIEAHHIQAWVDGGLTELDNLLHLCWHHHHVVHEGSFRVTRGEDGLVRCFRPDGTELRDPTPLAHVPRLEPVDDERIVPLWRGEQLDLAAAVDVVLDKVGAG
jgi:hypothetical protein